jgi:DNA polymerase-3 subunit beta
MTSSFTGGGTVSFEYAGETVVITSQMGRSTMKTLPFEDFPTLPFPEAPTAKFSVPGASLKTLISAVASCASPSTVRPELASIFLSFENGILKAVATDSFRLSEKKLSLSGKMDAFTMLIPAKNAVDIMQTIPDDAVEVLIDEHQCAFSWPSGIVTTRLVTLSYPDYAQIIPKAFVSEATLLRKDLESALRRTAIFSDTFQKVRLALDTKEKSVSFTARNNDVGETSESITASVTGEPIELSFNHRYLSAPLSLIPSESLTLSASGVGRPLVIRGVGDNSFLYLVMPMNQ